MPQSPHITDWALALITYDAVLLIDNLLFIYFYFFQAFSSFHEIGDLVKRFGGISARCWACVEDKVEYESCKAAILRATETRESHANKRV